jgi:hypothetical protein
MARRAAAYQPPGKNVGYWNLTARLLTGGDAPSGFATSFVTPHVPMRRRQNIAH